MKYVLGVYLPGLILGLFAFVFSIHSGLWPWVIVAWALISGLGIACGMHRIYSHKTHNLKPWMDNIVLFLAFLGGQGSSISWVAVHRGYHHRFSDTAKDLHSPQAHGIFHALFGWYWNMTETTVNHKFAVDLLRKKTHVFIHRHYINLLHAWIALLVVVGLAYSWAPLIVYTSALGLSLLQDNLVNVLCHTRGLGYRNYETPAPDASNNFWPLGYFGWGQGWHNNHHADVGAFSFRKKWWEFDPCVLWLPLLKLGSNPK
jgi:stearoyl-CoA desaturase (delta-9 desaturase)